MPNLGSSTAPSWAGWVYHGSAYAMASKYTTPAFDILVLEIHAYFAPRSSTSPTGHCAIWRDSDKSLLADANLGVIANDNGSLAAGIGNWQSHTFISQPIIPASTAIWIGGYCDKSLEYSTYDTSPHTFEKASGSTIGAFTSPSDTGQGPCGAYIVYSQIVKAPVVDVGTRSQPGLLVQSSGSIVPSGTDTVGTRAISGLAPISARVLSPTERDLGNNGAGLAVTARVLIPKLFIWRPGSS